MTLFDIVKIGIYKFEEEYGIIFIDEYLKLLNKHKFQNNNYKQQLEGTDKWNIIWEKYKKFSNSKSQQNTHILNSKWERGVKPLQQNTHILNSKWERGVKPLQQNTHILNSKWERGVKPLQQNTHILNSKWKRGVKPLQQNTHILNSKWKRGVEPLQQNTHILNSKWKRGVEPLQQNSIFKKLSFAILTKTIPKNINLDKIYRQFNKNKKMYLLETSPLQIEFNEIYKKFLDNINKINNPKYIICKDIIERAEYFIEFRQLKNYDELYTDIELFFSKEIKPEFLYTKNTNIDKELDHWRAFINYCNTYFYKDSNLNIRIKSNPYKLYISLEEQLQFQKDHGLEYSDEILNYSFCNKICFITCEIKGRINYDYLRFIKDNRTNNNLANNIKNDRDLYYEFIELFKINELMAMDDKDFKNLDFLNIIKIVNICKTRITIFFERDVENTILNENKYKKFLKDVFFIDNEFIRIYIELLGNNDQKTNNGSIILWIILITRIYMFHTSINYDDFVYKIKKYINHILNINLIYISNFINYKKTHEILYEIDTLLEYYNNLFKYILLASYYKFCALFFNINDDYPIIKNKNKNIGRGLSGTVYELNKGIDKGLENVTKSLKLIHLEHFIEEAYKQHNIYLILIMNKFKNYMPQLTNIGIGKTKIFIQMEKIYILSKFTNLNSKKNNTRKNGLTLLDMLNNIDYVNLNEEDKIDICIKIIYKTCEMLKNIQSFFTIFVHYDINLSNVFYDITKDSNGIYKIDKCYLIDFERTVYCYKNLYHLYISKENENNNIIKHEEFYKTCDMTYFLYKFTYMFIEKIIKVSSEYQKPEYFRDDILDKIYTIIMSNNRPNNIINRIKSHNSTNGLINLIKSNIYHLYSIQRFNDKKTSDIIINPDYNKYNKQNIKSIGKMMMLKYDELLKPKTINEFIFKKIFCFSKNSETNEFPNIYKNAKTYIDKKTNNTFKSSTHYSHITSNFIDIKKHIYRELFKKGETQISDFNEINKQFIPDNIIKSIDETFEKINGKFILLEL
jgi:hypothetical protein